MVWKRRGQHEGPIIRVLALDGLGWGEWRSCKEIPPISSVDDRAGRMGVRVVCLFPLIVYKAVWRLEKVPASHLIAEWEQITFPFSAFSQERSTSTFSK